MTIYVTVSCYATLHYTDLCFMSLNCITATLKKKKKRVFHTRVNTCRTVGRDNKIRAGPTFDYTLNTHTHIYTHTAPTQGSCVAYICPHSHVLVKPLATTTNFTKSANFLRRQKDSAEAKENFCRFIEFSCILDFQWLP